MDLLTNFILRIIAVIFVWSAVIFSQGTEITIVHVNDSHSHLDGTGPRDLNLNPALGGFSRAATVLFTLKATEPNPILLHAGDFCVGDFFFNKYFGVPELQMLNQIGFDAMTVGNHEFDLGPSTLEMIYTEGFSYGSFPIVSANLDLTGYPSLGTYISPYIIKTVSGVKVGIFGLTIPAPLSNPSPVVILENIPEIAFATVAELQSLGVNVIICLSHLGSNTDSDLAHNVPGINVIVGAHDHAEFTQPSKVVDPAGDTTFIVQAGSFYKNIGKLRILYNNGSVSLSGYELIPVNNQIPPVTEYEAAISELKQGIVSQYGDVYYTKVADAVTDMENVPGNNNYSGKDSPLGNFIADAYLTVIQRLQLQQTV
jgi:2',3'-cyclic-nucleotide 2'-phosphodiesterase (5'-nucleotidase family)